MNEARVSVRRRAGPATARLRGRFVVAARRAGRAARRGAAVRAGTHLAGVGGAARGAETDRARVPALYVRALVGPAEHELLGADANAITLRQLDRSLDFDAVHAASVAALQIFDEGAALIDDDARVLSGNRRIEKGNLTVVGTTDDRDAEREVELLQQETQPILRRGRGTKGSHGHLPTPNPSNPTLAPFPKPQSMDQTRPAVSLKGRALRFKEQSANVKRPYGCEAGAQPTTSMRGLAAQSQLAPILHMMHVGSVGR